MRTVPDLDALRLLVDVAATGSISSAGRAAGITQQSASQRLRAIEAQVGLTLLRRGTAGTTLTEAGILVVGWATKLLAVADEVEESIATLREDRAHVLRVAASMTIAEHLMPLWLVRLRQRHGTAVNLTATNSEHVRARLTEGLADVGFVEDGTEAGPLASMVVARDTLSLFAASDDQWAARARPLPIEQLADRGLTWREQGSGTRRVVEEALTARGVQASAPAVELTTTSGIRAAVAAGSPPAFLSRRAVHADVETGRLVEVTIDGLDLSRDLTALWVGSARAPAGPVRDLLAIATHADRP